jgi:hypothetical protein
MTKTFLMKKNLMKKKIAVFSCLVFLITSFPLFAQSQIDSSKRAEEGLTFSRYFNPINHFDDTFFSNELSNLHFNSKFLNDTSSIWLRTRMQLNGMIYQETFGSNIQSNILNPLNQQYSAMQNMKLFRSILGAVSVSAVGYLAYQHLKKYGFLKRK